MLANKSHAAPGISASTSGRTEAIFWAQACRTSSGRVKTASASSVALPGQFRAAISSRAQAPRRDLRTLPMRTDATNSIGRSLLTPTVSQLAHVTVFGRPKQPHRLIRLKPGCVMEVHHEIRHCSVLRCKCVLSAAGRGAANRDQAAPWPAYPASNSSSDIRDTKHAGNP